MATRSITVDYNSPPELLLYVGYMGEHNATELTLIPPKEMTDNEDIVSFCVSFLCEGEVIHSRLFTSEETIVTPLWSQLTQSPVLAIQLEGFDAEEEIVTKSESVSVNFDRSNCGNCVEADTDNPDLLSQVAAVTLKAHTHANSAVLDTVTERHIESWISASANAHTHRNKSILDGLTSEDMTQFGETIRQRHTHPNKSTLDKFGESNGTPTFNGAPIGGAEIESRYYPNDWENGVIMSESAGQIIFADMGAPPIPDDAIIVDITVRLSEDGGVTYGDYSFGGLYTKFYSGSQCYLSCMDIVSTGKGGESWYGTAYAMVYSTDFSQLVNMGSNSDPNLMGFTVHYLRRGD